MTSYPRFLLYSHDTFGLGHLRRNCKLANALASAFPAARIVIVTGSEKAGSFALDPRVELVRLPSVTKTSDGGYRSGENGRSRRLVLAERSRIIAETAFALRPDMFIADKEPLGLLGELEKTLGILRRMGTRLVLGLRDVLDEPDILKQEWAKKNITPQIEGLYDRFWVYGPPDFHDPLAGLDLSPDIAANTRFLGFIETKAPVPVDTRRLAALPERYLLVSAGGGGDGADVMMAVLAAYEHDPAIPFPPVFLLGPFMEQPEAGIVRERAARIHDSVVIEFETEPEVLLAGAAGTVAMCGYNTFCEVMSQDKPGLFIPREKPRLEQFIRATRASELGLCSMMRTQVALDHPDLLAAALRALPYGPRPSTAPCLPNMDALPALRFAVEEELGVITHEDERVSHA